MTDLVPTMKLRFVERDEPCEWTSLGTVVSLQTKRILQQWWEYRVTQGWATIDPVGEWRDVPLEKS